MEENRDVLKSQGGGNTNEQTDSTSTLSAEKKLLEKAIAKSFKDDFQNKYSLMYSGMIGVEEPYTNIDEK